MTTIDTEQHLLHLIKSDEELQPEEHKIFKEMLDRIEVVDHHCQNRGDMGGLDWGMEALNNAFEGLNTGIHLIAGQPNIGKSSFCLQLGWQIALNNKRQDEKHKKKAYVIYFSLDDNDSDLMPRIVALDQQIPINAVRSPKKYIDNSTYMHKREIGMERLRSAAPYFKMLDGKDGTSLEFIIRIIQRHVDELKEIDDSYQLVAIIDNFHDVEVEDGSFRGDDNAKYEYIAEKLDQVCTTYDMPIICTAEFRKLNSFRRPTVDDIRSAGKIGYKAKVIMLCYNEVAIKGEAAEIFYMRSDSATLEGQKQPILEVRVGKNKFESFKGRIYYELFPERGFVKEVTPNIAKTYSQLIIG